MATCRIWSIWSTTSTCTRPSWRADPGSPAGRPSPGVPGDRCRPDAVIPAGHSGAAERARPDPLRHSGWGRQLTRGRDPRHQRLPRPDHSTLGGNRHLRRREVGGAELRCRWCGLPEALVRSRTEAAAPGLVLTVTAGDAVGATPPISAFFDDTPTIEIMNMMGFSADGLGNHNFDKGLRITWSATIDATG